jgi:hypothetical protein
VKIRLHLALLRGAALLVRAPEREEWLAEWRAELWYVGRNRRTAFCLGAFRDAFWMRRHSPAPAYLQSPWECLAVLAVLAGLSLFFAFRLPLPREILFSQPPSGGLMTISGIPVGDYRQLPGDSSNFAFYGPAHFHPGDPPVALASRNLFELLHVPATATGDPGTAPLVLTRTAWRQYFASDPHIVSRRLTIAGRLAQVTAVVSDDVWRLPGRADAWLLVDEGSLGPLTTGYVLARVSPTMHSIWVHNTEGGVDRFTFIPLAEPYLLFAFLLVMGLSVAILPAVTSLSLGEYPVNRHALARATPLRRWIFLAAKIALVLPIALFGSIDLFSVIAVGLQAHSMVVGSVVGLRWVLMDQRRRCPVCLRVLTNPTSIGEPSRTLLEWYGTELICGRGHGLLHVPEIRNSYSEQRWLHLDSSWSSLF